MRGDYKVPVVASLKRYSPRPGNQLDYSTSVAWAIAWQASTILYAKNNKMTNMDDIVQHIFAPAYLYQNAIEDNDCSKGISLASGLKVAKEKGMPLFSQFVNFCNGISDPRIDSIARMNTITDYSKIFQLSESSERKIVAVKKTISEGYPAVVGFRVPPSFRTAKEFWQPKEPIDGDYQGHALCVVGYDDSKYGGAFEVANSWGGSWGNKGYMWIRYKDFADFVKYGYEVYVAEKDNSYRLKGDLKIELSNGSAMPVKITAPGKFKAVESYSSGTQFQVKITNEDPAFLYVIGSDLSGECFLLFPNNNTISAALTYKSSHIAIPDETHFIEFDDNAGTDFLCVLYSREELDIEGIVMQITQAKGTFYNKINEVLGHDLLNESINWSDSNMSFEGDSNNGTVVAAIVEIEHN